MSEDLKQLCGCDVKRHLDASGHSTATIVYCSQHAAAPAMHKALSFAKDLLKASILWTDYVDEMISPALELAKPKEVNDG